MRKSPTDGPEAQMLLTKRHGNGSADVKTREQQQERWKERKRELAVTNPQGAFLSANAPQEAAVFDC